MFPGQFFSVLGCPLLSRVHSEVHPNRMACANNLLKRKFGNIRELEMHKLTFLFLVQDTCVRLGLWGNLLNAIFVKVDMFLRTALLRVNVDSI